MRLPQLLLLLLLLHQRERQCRPWPAVVRSRAVVLLAWGAGVGIPHPLFQRNGRAADWAWLTRTRGRLLGGGGSGAETWSARSAPRPHAADSACSSTAHCADASCSCPCGSSPCPAVARSARPPRRRPRSSRTGRRTWSTRQRVALVEQQPLPPRSRFRHQPSSALHPRTTCGREGTGSRSRSRGSRSSLPVPRRTLRPRGSSRPALSRCPSEPRVTENHALPSKSAPASSAPRRADASGAAKWTPSRAASFPSRGTSARRMLRRQGLLRRLAAVRGGILPDRVMAGRIRLTGRWITGNRSATPRWPEGKGASQPSLLRGESALHRVCGERRWKAFLNRTEFIRAPVPCAEQAGRWSPRTGRRRSSAVGTTGGSPAASFDRIRTPPAPRSRWCVACMLGDQAWGCELAWVCGCNTVPRVPGLSR